MFGNLGMSEIIIIAGIALVLLGPEKFPEFAKIALRAYRDFRGYIDDIKRDVAEELKPVKQEIQQLSQYNPEDYVENLAKAVSSIGDEEKSKDSPSTPETSTPAPEAAAPAAEAPAAPAQPPAKHHEPDPNPPEHPGD